MMLDSYLKVLTITVFMEISLNTLFDIPEGASSVTSANNGSQWTTENNETPVPTTKKPAPRTEQKTEIPPVPTTWHQAPLVQSEGPLGVDKGKEFCWNFLSGRYSNKEECGDTPVCCVSSGMGSGCCGTGWECCGSARDPHLCCQPGMRCCGDPYHTSTCCYESDTCVYKADKEEYTCENKHWIPFLVMGVLWVCSLTTFLTCSHILYSHKTRREENFLAIENT